MVSDISSGAVGSLSPYGNRTEPFASAKAGKVENDDGKDAKEEKDGLSSAEQRQVAELAQTDRKVRQHEQMHIAAGRDLITSGPTYSYETGPDGQRYAVAGEVGIDTSKGSTPEETVQKAARIRAAALAPPDPSAQDRHVAALASQMQMEALQEIARQRQEETRANLKEAIPAPGSDAQEGPAADKSAGIHAYWDATAEKDDARGKQISLYA
jgi:type IV secretory pathway VirB10-like protein